MRAASAPVRMAEVINILDKGKSLDERIKAIEAKMGTKEYLSNEKMQSDLRALYERRIQLQHCISWARLLLKLHQHWIISPRPVISLPRYQNLRRL